MATAILDNLKRDYYLTWWALFLRGLLSVGIGVVILTRPLDSVAALALVIAFWSIFSGTVEAVQAFELRSLVKHWWGFLLSGLIGIAFGIAALKYYPVLSLAFAVTWVGLWLAFTGIIALYVSMQQKRVGVSWGWTATFGVLGLLAAGSAFVYPPATLAAIMGLIAAFSLTSGVALIIGAFKLRAVVHPVHQAVERMAH